MPVATTRARHPRFTTGTRICQLCWNTTPIGSDMFVVVGMGDGPLLVCPRCAEKVLRLKPTGEPVTAEGGDANEHQLDIFDQIKEHTQDPRPT
jgi:hypothetical protein